MSLVLSVQKTERILRNKPKTFRSALAIPTYHEKFCVIMNEIRDEDRIMQIATELGDSCGDRRHAILLTAHTTFTQQTQYTDNMATLNERQFFLLHPRHHTKGWLCQGAPFHQDISGVLSSLRGGSGTPPPFPDIAQQCGQQITCASHQREHTATVISRQVKS